MPRPQHKATLPARLKTRPLGLGNLRALDAVARHLNFRAAAAEMSLSQSAVTRQIQALEDEVGVALFSRHTRAVELTQAGLQLLRAASPSLDRLDAAVRRIRAHAGRSSVVVSTWASFASIWLIPRLEMFQAEYPHIDIHVHTSDAALDLDSSDADLALRYTRQSQVPQGAIRLFGERIAAVASPRLFAHAGDLKSPADLQKFALIEAGDLHTTQRLEWLTWSGWFRHNKLQPLEPRRWLTFDYAHQIIQAAQSGQGIALSRLPLVADSLVSGELVEVLPQLRLDSPMAYWLIANERSQQQPEVAAFSEWLLAQARIMEIFVDENLA